jgi:hypothetical protein
MPTLTNSTTVEFGPEAPTVAEISVTSIALPIGGTPTGKGRLIHPTLGTYDYEHTPSSWDNIDADVIIPPVWASAKTLQGSANTLWTGNIRDVVCVERWDADAGDIKMRMSMLRMLISFFTTPPDPASAYVQWWPSYTTELGFKVAITNLQVGGQGITLDTIASRKDWARREVTLTLKLLGRL